MNQVYSETVQLSAGQKAAATRRANQGKTGPILTAKEARAADVSLAMVIVERESQIDVSFEVFKAGNPAGAFALPMDEYGLAHLSMTAWASANAMEMFGFDELRIDTGKVSIAQLDRELPAARKADKMVKQALQDSEDYTFRQVVATLANSLRVSEIKVQPFKAQPTSHKRGAAYVTALRLEDAFLARQLIALKEAEAKIEATKKAEAAKAEKAEKTEAAKPPAKVA